MTAKKKPELGEIVLSENQTRQGDVLFVRVDERPRWAKEAAPLAHGRFVAEFGEASGHEHALHGKSVLGFRATDPVNAAFAGLDYLEIGGSGAEMRHEFANGGHAEHEPVALGEGCWERAVQVEYDPDEERRIAD